MQNMFLQAKYAKEIPQFILGVGDYYCGNSLSDDELQDASIALSRHVMTLVNAPNFEEDFSMLLSGLQKFAGTHVDRNKSVYLSARWLFAISAEYQSLFNSGETAIAHLIKSLTENSKLLAFLTEQVESRAKQLMDDRRWAGAEWNSENGLLGPIRRTLKRAGENFEQSERASP